MGKKELVPQQSKAFIHADDAQKHGWVGEFDSSHKQPYEIVGNANLRLDVFRLEARIEKMLHLCLTTAIHADKIVEEAV